MRLLTPIFLASILYFVGISIKFCYLVLYLIYDTNMHPLYSIVILFILIFCPIVVSKYAYKVHRTRVHFGLYTHVFHFLLFTPDMITFLW